MAARGAEAKEAGPKKGYKEQNEKRKEKERPQCSSKEQAFQKTRIEAAAYPGLFIQ